MWWRIGALACAALACARPRSATEVCVAADHAREPEAQDRCEQAWQTASDVAAAVAGAHDALVRDDRTALKRWADRAPETIEGARILHFWGLAQRDAGDHS